MTPVQSANRELFMITTTTDHRWVDDITLWQQLWIFGSPIVALVFIIVFLRYLWPAKSHEEIQSIQTETSETQHGQKVPQYGTTVSHIDQTYQAADIENVKSNHDQENTPLVKKEQGQWNVLGKKEPSKTEKCEEGEVAGDYSADWTKTFDMVFLIGMVLYAIGLTILTYFVDPSLLHDRTFWLLQIPKLLIMMAVSAAGGLLCRYFCEIDEQGYIITNKSSKFKVNYTRKIQHFAAYFIPLIIRFQRHDLLGLPWGDFFTMLGFLVLIKPIRERIPIFMLQFNSLDRPEDRPHTLKWIIAGNIAPGLLIIIFFHWLLSGKDEGALTFIIVFIASVGDGIAEPVGITWGKHKYKTRACFSPRQYTRSWEGSACLFMSGMIFPAIQYASFDNFLQVFLAMIILPPTMTIAEATAPHTMDTPVLMGGCGLILWLISKV